MFFCSYILDVSVESVYFFPLLFSQLTGCSLLKTRRRLHIILTTEEWHCHFRIVLMLLRLYQILLQNQPVGQFYYQKSGLKESLKNSFSEAEKVGYLKADEKLALIQESTFLLQKLVLCACFDFNLCNKCKQRKAKQIAVFCAIADSSALMPETYHRLQLLQCWNQWDSYTCYLHP